MLTFVALNCAPVHALPDLQGYGAIYPFDLQTNAACWGDTIPLQFNVANISGDPAGAFGVGVYMSTNTTFGDADDYLIGPVNYGSLPAMNYSAWQGNVILPSVNPLPGQPTNVYFGMIVDYQDTVSESNEGNNQNLGHGIDRDDVAVIITPPVPDIFATDSTAPHDDLVVAFGGVAHDGPGNALGSQTVTLLNKGGGTLTVSNLVLTGSTNFALTQIASSLQNFIQPGSLPRVIANKGTEIWVLTLEFDPTATNAHAGTLTVTSNDPDTPSLAISLTGTGVPAPDIALTTPESVETDFGTVVDDGAGGYSATNTITLKNAGTGPLTVSQDGIVLLSGTNYSLLAVTSSTRGAIDLGSGPDTIAANAAELWDLSVRFDPLSAGQHTDALRVLSDDPDEPVFVVSLRGHGAGLMQLALTDSQGSPTNRAIVFPGVHADGAGKELATATVTLWNAGEAPLTVASNGLALSAGTQFLLHDIVSDLHGAIDLSLGAAQVAGSTSETWLATLHFDPGTTGALADTLEILTDDPSEPTVQVALSGQGLDRPAIDVTDSIAPSNDLAVGFGPVLNDGPAGNIALQTLVLRNVGIQPLVVAQNGLVPGGSAAFSVTGVVSSVDGPVDIGSVLDADRTIDPAQTETWTLSLACDPTGTGGVTGTLSISSDDPSNSTVVVDMTATGVVPTITLVEPALTMNVSAGSVLDIAWLDSYAAGNASIALWVDTDTNAADGLIPIAAGIAEADDQDTFAWRIDEALTGGQYHVYATIADGAVTNGHYAPGRLTVDGYGAFVLRSPVEVTSPDYAYEYEYEGQVYQGVTHLVPGDNVVTVSTPKTGGGTATHQFTVRLVPSLIHAETIAHDDLNRVEQIKNGNGIETSLIYDPMNRLVRRESSNGALVEYGYDVLGRRTRMRDATGTTFYEWDELDRLTAVITSKNEVKGDGDDLALAYEYDLAGRRTALVYPGGERIEYTYDDAGRMLTVTNLTRSLLFTYAYNATNGLLSSLSRPNGIDTDYAYDGMGRLTNIWHHRAGGGELVVNFGYVLDAAGRATQFRTTETGGVERVEQYTYDRFDRLAEAVYSEDGVLDVNDRTVRYSYDGNGNRLSMTTKVDDAVAEVRLYQYGNENRLLRVTDGSNAVLSTYDYDAAGNMIQETTADRTRFFSYDERNLLTSVIDGSNYVTYAYNGDGQRVRKTINGEVSTFVVDGTRHAYATVEERNGAGAITRSETFGTTRLASWDGASQEFALTDRPGSVRAAMDASGILLETYSYDVFGDRQGATSASSPYGFAGERHDYETGLLFLRARLYEPVAARFLTKDPLGVASGLNGYIYCGNDAVNHVDPLGCSSEDIYWSVFWSEFAKGAHETSLGFIEKIPGVTHEMVEALYAYDGPIEASQSYWEGQATYDFSGGLIEHVIGSKIVGALSKVTLSPVFKAAARKDIQAMVKSGGDIIAKFQAYNEATMRSVKAFKQFHDFLGVYNMYNEAAMATESTSHSAPDIIPDDDTRRYSFGGDPPDGGGDSEVFGNTWMYIDGSGFFQQNVGGVLLDKAAELVGSNLSDIRGAVYDPVSGQFLFLGTNDAAAVQDIDLDYLYTALQAVYGSAVPPYVTLDPPAVAHNQWTDYGDGDGIFEPGEAGGFMLFYEPVWTNEDTTVDVRIEAEWSGTPYTWIARFYAVMGQHPGVGNWECMRLFFDSWVAAPPAGVSLDMFGWVPGTWRGSVWIDSSDQYTPPLYMPFTLQNASGGNFLVNNVRVIPARQHRRFGGRVEGTRLGWVMLEGDRVMKCLAVGRDNLHTNIAYNSSTIAVPGYSNMAERAATGNIRMWFTPNEMTLKRHLDPISGRASIVFDKASVALNTESYMMGLPQPPGARAFADHFTAEYDAFAALAFPCVDPDDPAGTNIVQVKIFEQLREAMQAVALARFFRDNGVPVDMWWMNAWTPPTAYSPRSAPTAYNEECGMIVYGGVEVNRPNTYVPSATAASVADVVQAAHPDRAGDPGGDLKQQVWTNSTELGELKAVAVQTDPEPQHGTVRLVEVDLNFASPGAVPLRFSRFYHGAWMGDGKMGPGWRYTPLVLEFERPSWFDENGLMQDGGEPVWKDADQDTRLRSGALRVVDLASGATLDFTSSLLLGYAVDNIGNTVITLSGLTNEVPAFTPGLRQNGATLVQTTNANSYGYIFTRPDGAVATFDHEGRLWQTFDRYANEQRYRYDALGNLTNVTDAAGQSLVLAYEGGTGRVASVSGPAGEQVTYTYDGAGCLATATHVRSGAATTYAYNADRQLTTKTLFNGLVAIQSDPDLKGRAVQATDARSNTVVSAFTQDSAGTVRTTETEDPLVVDPEFEPWRSRFDRQGRLLSARDATGAETSYGYAAGSLLPTVVNLPIAGRPDITIERNAYGYPTRITDPGNLGAQDITAAYDPVSGLLQQRSDAAGRNTEITRNQNKSVSRVRRYLGGQPVDIGYGYTTNGALFCITNALGTSTATFYRDALGRATNVVDATGISMRYQYDALGRVWKVVDPRLSGPVEYVYDDFDRVIEIKYPVGSVFFEYDAGKGWLTRRTDILGRATQYTRDPDTGDILTVIDEVAGGPDRVTTMSYNRFGQLTNITPPDAEAVTFSYDDLGRPLGSSEADAMPPGAPKALDSDRADDGVPTFATNHLFTWGAPHTDSGIAGYSVGHDQAADETVDTVGASNLWADVAVGTHTVTVRAVANNGLWGPEASFVLVVRAMTAYDQWRLTRFAPDDAYDDAKSGPDIDFDGDGIDNLDEYYADTYPTNERSLLWITNVVFEGGVRIDWQGGQAATQWLEMTSSGITNNDWSAVFTNLPPTAEQESVIYFGTNVQGIFRLKVGR